MHRSVYMFMLAGAATFALAGQSAKAQDAVSLKAQVTDADGRITIGDVFDNAGQASDVVLGARAGATAVLDAGRVQAMVRQAGLSWSNPQGLRRIVVSAGADSAPTAQAARTVAGRTQEVLVFTRALNAGDIVGPADIAFQPVQAHMATGAIVMEAQDAIGKSVRMPIRNGGIVRASDLTSPTVIKRAEMVRVAWEIGGMSLSMTGQAQKDGAIGDVIMVQNPQSKKLIQAVVTGPGTAVTGADAQALRQQNLYSAR